jgi:hypothetical protein
MPPNTSPIPASIPSPIPAPFPAPIPAPIPAPVRRLRKQARATVAAFAIVLVICTWWAFTLPKHDAVTDLALSEPAQDLDDDVAQPLDLAAFDAEIWRSPPVAMANTEVASSKPARPAPRLDVQLVAITTDAGKASVTRSAALYDVGKNQLLLCVQGDSVGGFTVSAIDMESVTFTSGAHTTTLKLRSDRPPLKLGRAKR